jgi:hypothetical protein
MGYSASGFAEAFDLYKQLTDAAVGAAINTADSDLNSSPSIGQANRLATVMRLEAAKQLGGTATTLSLAQNGAFCSRPPTTPAVRAAIAVLRDAAPAPVDLSSTSTSTLTLLDGDTANGSVRQRLAEFYGDKALSLAGPGAIEQKFNLDLSTFDEARAVMNEEEVAFARSASAALPPRQHLLQQKTFLSFAGTATAPKLRPAAFYGALARGRSGGTSIDTVNGQFSTDSDEYDENYLAFISAATSIVAQRDALPPTIQDVALGPLALLLSNKELLANVYAAPTAGVSTFSTFFSVTVAGLSPADGIRLAVGEDDLRCAVQGSIEGGAPIAGGQCSLSGLRTFVPATGVDPGAAFSVVSKLSGTVLITNKMRIYLLRPRVPPADPTNPYAAAPLPGGYEALGGLTLSFDEGGAGFVVVRGNEERIAGILEPSPKWCAHPHKMCDGSTFDERIPLENELTDNSNGFEDSWRHYLDLAKSAAVEADQLGNDYITTSLSKAEDLTSAENFKEQQLEQANEQLEKLQTLCGFTADTQSLLKLLSDSAGAITGATSGACGSDGSCSPGYTCTGRSLGVAGTCVLELEAYLKANDGDPDIRRIEDCLTGGGLIPFVSLGDLPLCLWRDPVNPNLVCQGAALQNGSVAAVPQGHCPQILPRAQAEPRLSDPVQERAREISACNALFASDQRLTGVKPTNATTEVTSPLGYFAISGAADDKPTQDMYKELRRLDLSTYTDLMTVKGIRAKNLLDPNRLVEAINGLDWESRFDNHGAIKFLGGVIYETGVGTKAPLPSKIPDPMNSGGPLVDAPWPCGVGRDNIDLTDKRPWLGATDRPASYDCTSTAGRQLAINEMFAAVAAAKLLGPIVDDQLYDFDDQGYPLIPFGSLQQDELKTPMIVKENHWWLTDLIGGPALVKPDITAPTYECGTYAFPDSPSTKSCDSSKALPLTDGSAVLQSTCQTGTAYTRVNAGQNQYGDQFANLGCFHPGRLHAFDHAVTDTALQRLSVVNPQIGGKATPWLVTYLEGRKSLGDKIATYTWNSDNVHVPGGVSGDAQVTINGFVFTGRRHELVLTGDDLFMGLSLIARVLSLPPRVSFEHPPEVRTVDDLEGVSLYIQTLSDQITNGVSALSFANVPTRVADALRKESANGATPQFSGDMAVQMSAARDALLKINENGPLIANEVKQLGVDIRDLKIILRKSAINQDIANLQFASQLSTQLTNCAVSATHVSADPVANGGTAAAAAITCANSIAQIGFASDLAALSKQDSKLDGELAIADFGGKFSAHATAMQTIGSQLAEAEENLDSALATIEGKRSEAKSALVSALYAASFQAQHQAEVTQVLANLSDGKQRRYQKALTNAKHLAFVAKRAIEQRLGVRLADITEDYPLVEAPAKWESTVCTLTGLDYTKLAQTNPNAPQSFANGFVGDYVTKLENFVESYTLQKNFHEGTDTAVISLRDDLMNVRKECSVPAPNLLLDAGQLDQSRAWSRENCPVQDVGDGVTQPLSGCIDVSALTDGPAFADINAAQTVGYSLTFGSAATTDSGLVQALDLPGGRYRFSWYTKETRATSAWHGGAQAGTLRSDASSMLVTKDDIVPASVSGGWNRRYMIFRLASPGTVRVGFSRPTVPTETTTVSGPMLERIVDTDEDQALVPFVNTNGGLTEPLLACEDSGGSMFRSTRWTRNCMKLCSDGFADNCATGNSKEYCYWEAQFGFSQRDIQLGKVLNFSGFARGNFNYRIDSLGINFVGTGTRNCGTSDFPQACSGSGSIPFSLIHTGPFFIRNFRGDDVESRIFDGTIEHARGLATERYLTNPISDTDSALIKQYLRSEFSGRPLDGNFVLRIWDEDGVDFNAIQDVQVVLNYRYWTKFD